MWMVNHCVCVGIGYSLFVLYFFFILNVLVNFILQLKEQPGEQRLPAILVWCLRCSPW